MGQCSGCGQDAPLSFSFARLRVANSRVAVAQRSVMFREGPFYCFEKKVNQERRLDKAMHSDAVNRAREGSD
jgi:hypothetical protein